ncbi:MAG: type IV pilus assembly protein PilM [Candidatus Eisenbacteria bacterium]
MVFGSGGIVTGLDVGATSVKAATLQHRRGGVRLVGLAMAEIGDSDDREGAVVSAIRAALEGGGAGKNTPVVSVVGGPGVSVKHVTFPEMPRQALAESIRWEARKHVPFGGSDFVLDFQTLEGGEGDEEGELQVLLAAVETRLLDSHIELLKAAGVEPDTVDLAPLALMNEVEEEGLLNGEAVAVIDLGVSAISMSVYRRKGLLFARSIPLVAKAVDATAPGDDTVAGRDKKDGKSDAEPGKAKADGKSDAGSGKAKVDGKSDAGSARAKADAAGGWRKTVLREVRRSLAFYNNETGKQGIDRLYLTGGRALAPGIDEMLQNELGVATEVMNPLESLTDIGVEIGKLKPESARFAIALGLARRS